MYLVPEHLRPEIDFVIISSDQQPNVLDTLVKRGAELSTEHQMFSWIRCRRRWLEKPGKPKCVVRVNWERLTEDNVQEILNSYLRKNSSHILREVGDMESKWTMFKSSICRVMAKFGPKRSRKSFQKQSLFNRIEQEHGQKPDRNQNNQTENKQEDPN